MSTDDLNRRIVARGRELFASIADAKPALFSSATWTGRVMQWCLRSEEFKTRLFRFVDVFPALQSTQQITGHLREYFGEDDLLPPVLASGVRLAGRLGDVGGALLGRAIAANIREMARQFIVGETTEELTERLVALHRDGYAAVIDVLGEATLSPAEAAHYEATYLQLLTILAAEQQRWPQPPMLAEAPAINLAVKPSALYCLANPMDFAGSVEGILAPLRRIAVRAIETGAFLCIDMESYRFKGITLEVYRRLKQEFRNYPHLGLALQAYLRDSEADLAELLTWAERGQIPIAIRLVKGAYWDYETVRARQMGWPVPVRTSKADTDATFERMAAAILRHHQICHLACASHNLRSIAAVLEMARALGVPDSRYEFQMLYGMAEPVRHSLLAATGKVRLYCAYGQLVPGMGYLVRRLLENTANESFLRLSFADGAEIEQLLADPAELLRHGATQEEHPAPPGLGFRNEPAADFTNAEVRARFPAAIAAVRSLAGGTVPLWIDGREIRTSAVVSSCNPNRPTEVLGAVCQAGHAEVSRAIDAASRAFPAWQATPVRERAALLRRVADLARQRLFELAAWQVLEIGKQWDQAHADVAEAIDFLEYYAAAAPAFGSPQRLGELPGEENILLHEGRGVAAVISPWNFPMAIACGMVSAALVTGNAVVFKPSSLTGLNGHHLVELFRAAGVPAGVLNFIPGRGGDIGDLLSGHHAIATVAFTGSSEVGQRLIERAAAVPHPEQRLFKRVMAEMGGKNAIIVDDDADLDETVPCVLASAFGFQGQKCSACSRLIVLDAIYERLVDRLVAAAQAWRLGPAEDPSFAMGAMAEAAALNKILDYIEIGRQEGQLLYASPVPEEEGYWVPLTIFAGIEPHHRLAQEEIFGPVLSVMRAVNFDQALAWANASRYALTGGLFSRSPGNIERARREFRVGNLYINRAITGAMVGRQPFGGGALSGLGSKAGGADYLRYFMDQRVVTENTVRRGFTPAAPER